MRHYHQDKSKNDSQPLVLKVSTEYETIANEVKILFKLRKIAPKNNAESLGFPTPISFGLFMAKNVLNDEPINYEPTANLMKGYYVMPKYEICL